MSFYVLCLLLIPLVYIWIKYKDKQQVATKGTCLICDEVFLETDLREVEEKFFCLADYDIFKKSQWTATKELRITQNNLDHATSLQDFKNELKKENIPSYILSDYTVEGVDIVTISTLYQRTSDVVSE